MLSLQKDEKKVRCPYFNDKECGHPDKAHCFRCSDVTYRNCVIFQSLEEYKKPKKGTKKADGTDEGVPISGDVL